jgi:hypothetical protein
MPKITCRDGIAWDLGSWVRDRRNEYKASKLSRDRIEALEKVPGWSWDPRAYEFAEYLHLANTYAQQHGNHCSPPSHMPKITCRDGIAWDLGKWVRDKRSEFKASKLSRDRIEALEKVPGWSWGPRADEFAE